MSYAADLHLHSPYARGTSNKLRFEGLARWAKLKGIDLLASADFTHPDWFRETASTLGEAGDGLYEYGGVKFVLGTEVSCNAQQGGRSRRVHMLIFAPSMEGGPAHQLDPGVPRASWRATAVRYSTCRRGS